VKIEIWSDFTCPYCYIGKRKLEMAIEQFGQKDDIEIEYKSFELDPEANILGEDTKHSMLMKKYGISSEQAIEMTNRISTEGSKIGLHIQFDDVLHTNTFHAHRLVKYAVQHGKDHELVERLFERYFIHQQNIGKRDVLLSLAEEAGLDMEEIDELLCMNRFSKKVRLEEELAQDLGITGVPFYVFNETYAISGVQPTELFLNILHELCQASNREEKNTTDNSRTTYCTDNKCEIE